MSRQNDPLQTTPPRVLSGAGVELLNCGPTRSTGFSIISFLQGDKYRDNQSRYNYIFVVLKGKITLTCKLYRHCEIQHNHMVFVPKDSFFEWHVDESCELFAFAFTTTIIRTDKDILYYFCENARKFNYTFNTLKLCTDMSMVIHLIRRQILSNKLKGTEICEAWNTLFFNTVQTFYDKSQVVAFMRPLLSTSIDFKTFIENNYIQSGGNVTSLIDLSGIATSRFHSLFQENFGMTAKNWLDMKARQRILAMASTEGITVTDIAKVFKVSTQRFYGLCRRLFECSPRELIQREQKKHKMEMESIKEKQPTITGKLF